MKNVSADRAGRSTVSPARAEALRARNAVDAERAAPQLDSATRSSFSGTGSGSTRDTAKALTGRGLGASDALGVGPLTPADQELLQRFRSIADADRDAAATAAAQVPDTGRVRLTGSSVEGLVSGWNERARALVGQGDPDQTSAFLDQRRSGAESLARITTGQPSTPSEAAFAPELKALREAHPGATVELVAVAKGVLDRQIHPRWATRGGRADPGADTTVDVAIALKTPDGKVQHFGVLPNLGSNDQLARFQPVTVDPGQAFVSLDARQAPAQGAKATVTADVAIDPAQTGKAYQFNERHPQAAMGPYFTRFLQLRGNEPRQLSGTQLEAEVGAAMNVPPNHVPSKAQEPLVAKGDWSLYQGEATETLRPVVDKINQLSEGKPASVATLPVVYYGADGQQVRLPLFRVGRPDGSTAFVDNVGREYQDFADWKANNQLPPGRMTYPRGGVLSAGPLGRPALETANTPQTIDTALEHITDVADKVALVGGVVVGAAAVIGTGGLATPIVAGAGVAMSAYAAARQGSALLDSASHGQDINPLTNADARSQWLGLGASVVGLGAMGASTRAVSALAADLGHAGAATTAASVLSKGAAALNGATMATGAVDLARNWDSMPAADRLANISQLAFWGAGLSRHLAAKGATPKPYSEDFIRERLAAASPEAPPVSKPPAAKVSRPFDAQRPTPVGDALKGAATAASQLTLGPARAAAFGQTVLPALIGDASSVLGVSPQRLAPVLEHAVKGAGAEGPSLGLKRTETGLAADTDYPPRAANATWDEFASTLGISKADAAAVKALNARIGAYPQAEGQYAPAFSALSPDLQQLATRVSRSLLGEDVQLTSVEKAFKANLVLNNLTWHMTNWQRAAADATRADPMARNNVFNTYSDNLRYAQARGGTAAVIDMAISDAYNAGKPGVGRAQFPSR